MNLLVAAMLAGCAAGTQPHDMSASEHHETAQYLEQASREHSHRADPGGNAVCGGSTIEGSSPCWTAVSSQATHEQEARRLRELAQQHRAAGDVLLTAESKACEGMSAADRDVSPFFHRSDIASVSDLRQPEKTGAHEARSGALIRFRAVEGLTLSWLGRAVECHLARSAALGHSAALDYCPLAVRGAQARVSSTSAGLEVEIWTADPTTGAEILRRALKLEEAPASR